MANKKKQDEALAAVQAQTEENGLSAAQSGYSAAGLGSRAEVENALANASYKPSQTVTSAENALKEWQTNRPDDYESRYQDKIDQLLGIPAADRRTEQCHPYAVQSGAGHLYQRRQRAGEPAGPAEQQ